MLDAVNDEQSDDQSVAQKLTEVKDTRSTERRATAELIQSQRQQRVSFFITLSFSFFFCSEHSDS